MNCPVDGTALMMTTREGVEIDYCPKCRGIWLDRGELDKLIERAARVEQTGRAALNTDAPKAKRDAAPMYDDSDHDFDDFDRRPLRREDDRDYRDNRDHPQKKRKGGFLGEIFDIFD